jgi:hypothetical protein
MTLNASVLTMLQILEQLPEGLAIAILSAVPVNLEPQLECLPKRLHRLAINAAFPSISHHRSLALDFGASRWYTRTAVAILQAAATASSGLRKLSLDHIPLHNDHLLQLISTACKSALDVSLSFEASSRAYTATCQPVSQLVEALINNVLLTNLHLSVLDEPELNTRLEGILGALTGLQSLSLQVEKRDFGNIVPVPGSIVTLGCLTHLSLGRYYDFMNLPQIVPRLTSLQSLCLTGCNLRADTPVLPHCTADPRACFL